MNVKDTGTDSSFAHYKEDILHAAKWLLIAFAAALMLTACGGMSEMVNSGMTEGGTYYIERIDSPEMPCMALYACSQPNAVPKVVWSTSLTRHDHRRHERGHIDNMLHTPWMENQCARVIVGDKTGRYRIGDLICFDNQEQESITRDPELQNISPS